MPSAPEGSRIESRENLALLWVLWGIASLAMPVVMAQALWLRRRIPRLPEASGARLGSAGTGDVATRLLIVGESTAVGVGARQLSEAIPGFLCRELAKRRGERVEWTLVGKNGASLGRMRSILTREQASIQGHRSALVLAGVNDVFGLSSLRRWRRDIMGMVALLRSAGCTKIVFSALPPIERFSALKAPLRWVLGVRARLLDVYLRRELMLQEDCVHARVEFPGGAAYLAEDGVHPSSLGYQQWSEQLVAAF